MADALRVLDARAMRRWFEHALRSLLAVREQVNILNVFPVADSDTGTNLVLTLAGAADAAATLPADATLAELASSGARGALVGARGNSGVIISQAMRGLSAGIAGRSELDGAAFAHVLGEVAREARTAVERPVEGTILTVADAAAQAAADVAAAAPGPAVPLLDVVRAAVGAAVTALEGTRAQLPVLAERAVVDAGAAGFVILLGALEAVVDGDGRSAARSTERARQTLAQLWSEPRRVMPEQACSLGESVVGHSSGGGEFEVMYVLRAGEQRAAEVRRQLDEAGDSVAVVGGMEAGDVGLWQVHVHTDDPTAVLADLAAMSQLGVRSLTAPASGIVACTRAPGLAAPLARTGASVCLFPDDAGLVRAVVDTGSAEVLVLPCDQPSADLARRTLAAPVRGPLVAAQQVEVLDSDEECVVLAVASELLPGEPAATRRTTATEIAGQVRAGRCGVDGAASLLTELTREQDDLLTVVTGASLQPPARDDVLTGLAARLAELAPDAEIVVLDGGQAGPELLLGAQ